jgi:hypothetical protein
MFASTFGASFSCSIPKNSFVSVSFSFQADTGPIVPGRTMLARKPFAFAASTRISLTRFVCPFLFLIKSQQRKKKKKTSNASHILNALFRFP